MDFNEEVIKQWHPIKNGSLIINQFSKSSKQKVWWLCDKKCNEGCLHEWEATIGDRIIKRNSEIIKSPKGLIKCLNIISYA